MRKRKNIYLYIILPLLAFVSLPEAWGQTGSDPKDYYDEYDKETKIKSKSPKWYDLHKIEGMAPSIADNFDKEHSTFTLTIDELSGKTIQASHVLVDTIYVHKGTIYKLQLPYRSADGNNYSVRSYQRWYNFRTGNTFEVTNGVNNGTENVKDLLYPTTNKTGQDQPRRFVNGYVGDANIEINSTLSRGLLDMYFYYPTNQQYNSFTNSTNVNPDNNEYLIACDVSSYTDYMEKYDGKFPDKFNFKIEPTLSCRIIYYIRAIENEKDWRHKFFEEQKNVSEKADQKYLEEYEISMPSIRIPDKTQEMVSIATAANAYAVPVGTGETDTDQLSVTLENGDSNTANISLCNKKGETQTPMTLSGNNRIIHFKFPNTKDTYGRESVPDGSTATILVTKTVNETEYRIARFRLTFKESSVFLTQSLIENITQSNAGEEWNKYEYRTPEYLHKNYTFVTGQDFDFDPAIASLYGQKQVYPYPLGWSESSYAFYDGSVTETFKNKDIKEFLLQGTAVPQWGYYAIVNNYTECKDSDWGIHAYPLPPQLPPVTGNRDGKASTYHMFVDASDQPGVIARLEFDERLCPGSELFVSAAVKVAKAYDPDGEEDNAAMLFTIMGVSKDGNNRNVYTPIYRHQTGQIPGTYIDPTNTKNSSKALDVAKIPGFGSSDGASETISDNQWLQVYFSFTNKSDTRTDFDSYVLQIDNNSASTSGGDMYIDDIRVYIAPTKAEVKQKSPTCNANKVDALLQMRLDWDRLLSRLGVEELKESSSEVAKAHVSFCFIDSAAYISRYEKIPDPTNNEDACKEAFEKSIIPLSYPIKTKDGKESKTIAYKFGKLLFDPCYKGDDNQVYDPKITNIQTDIENAQDAGHFFRLPDNEDKAVTADIYCGLEPFRTYFLVLEENHDQEEHNKGDEESDYIPDIERFKYFYLAPQSKNSCVAKTSFQLEAMNSIKVNGMLLENQDQTFCNGQIINFGVQLKADTDNSGELKPVTGDVYYDWFLGSLEEFQKEQDDGSISIHQALINFRAENDKATTATAWVTDNNASKTLLTNLETNGKLILRQTNLNAHITDNDENMFKLVVLPIPITLGEGNDKTIIICTDPLEALLKINGNAPEAQVGFEEVVYPDEKIANPDNTYLPSIRVSKDIQKTCNSSTTMLEIPLRNIKASTKSTSASSFTKSTNHPHLYLIDSNDPVILQKIAQINNEGNFESETWPVATIDAINAVPGKTSYSVTADQYLRIHFGTAATIAKDEGMPEANFREGYWYTLLAYFNEGTSDSKSEVKDDSKDSSTSTCEGSFTFNLKVVPEYQKWSGPADGSGNWNNDANWLRSTATELRMTGTDATSYDEGYPTAGETRYGFVPMDFTKVIIPEGKQVQLYKAPNKTNATEIGGSHPVLDLAPSDKPATLTEAATKYIEYDLMVKAADPVTNNVAYNCQNYYTNTVDQIHFEPSTAMPHAEYLTYQKAWVDYKLTGARWYTLASPLQSVVAGDWYTQNTGSQTTEYFKDITFNTTGYSRFQPSVYQRGWKQQANMITIDDSGSETVAIAGNWSGVYNDVTVPYTPGLGFSVKVLDLPAATPLTDDPAVALFRFPKADTQYSYYKDNNTTTGNPIQVRTSTDEKKNIGKLKSDELAAEGSPTITVTLSENTASTDADYHLIGNPFMSYLNAKKFFDVNTNLQNKFWLVTDGNQDVAVGSNNGSDWITNIETTTTIAPLQSFFVVEKAGTSKSEDNNTVTFNADMQVLGNTTALKTSSSLPLLTLVATTADARQSRAVIAYDRTASEEYAADEDAELFLDSNLGDLPAIYTVAGTMAASINRTSDLWNIPVGIYGNSNESKGNNNETVTLSFEGLDRFTGTTLYDTEKRTETPLHSNSRLTIAANTYGRYFLRAGTPTGNGKIETETIRIYTIARGQLIVTATENLQTVAIYDFAGRLLRYSDTLPGCLFTTHLDKGNYIVRATTGHQQQTSKIQIR